MKQGIPSRRPYHSAVREHQAEVTRRKILAAAEELFVRHGYSETSVSAIAAKAGVAQQTVYAVFRNKSSLVISIFNQILGDEAYRRRYASARESGNPDALLHALSAIASEIYTNKRLLFDRLIDALGVLPGLREDIAAQRIRERELLRTPVTDLRAMGVMRPELDDEDAVDLLWALTSAAFYMQLVKLRGWSDTKYAQWLEHLLRRELTTLSDGTRPRKAD